MLYMKPFIFPAVTVSGKLIASLFGSFDLPLQTLLILMGVHIISDLFALVFFDDSSKRKTSISHTSILKSIFRKCMILIICLVAHRLDMAFGVNYIRSAVIIAFIISEAVSILEVAELMGMQIPKVIKDALDIFRRKIQ